MKQKTTPKIKLNDLLRRRKMNLKQMLDEHGITTYEGLLIRCDRMGCLPPTEDEFFAAEPRSFVNNPVEGIVVVDPPLVVDDLAGRRIDVDDNGLSDQEHEAAVASDLGKEMTLNVPSLEAIQKKARAKKEAN